MSMTSGLGISHRKKGDCAPPEADGIARCFVVCRCDAPRAAATAADGLGASGRTGSGARHGAECPVCPVWSAERAHGSSCPRTLTERDQSGGVGVFDRDSSPLPECPHDLAVAGPRTGSYRRADPATRCGVRDRAGVVAPAMARVERQGSVVAGVKAARGGEPAGGEHRGLGSASPRLGPRPSSPGSFA